MAGKTMVKLEVLSEERYGKLHSQWIKGEMLTKHNKNYHNNH